MDILFLAIWLMIAVVGIAIDNTIMAIIGTMLIVGYAICAIA
jgi:hypothetical protein